eukprot:5211326-Amphidinium_carterae.1
MLRATEQCWHAQAELKDDDKVHEEHRNSHRALQHASNNAMEQLRLAITKCTHTHQCAAAG